MSNYKIYNEKLLAKRIYPIINEYLYESIRKNNIRNINKKDLKKFFTTKKKVKKISNLNHNGALLPKYELSDEYFKIFEKFKKVIKKYIPKNSLIHFPIIIRVNNLLSNKKNKYSATYPHFDSWAGQPQHSEIISYNVESNKNSPVMEILKYNGKKKLTLKKKKRYKNVINPIHCESIYKSKKGDFIMCGPGTLHRTSSGKSFRVFLECRFINKKKLKKSDEKKFTDFYYPYNKFFKISEKNTKILTKLGSIANSRFGVDIKRS